MYIGTFRKKKIILHVLYNINVYMWEFVIKFNETEEIVAICYAYRLKQSMILLRAE